MAKASNIVLLGWLASDATDDKSAHAVDAWLLENLQDKDLGGDLAMAKIQEVDFCHSRRQFVTSLSDLKAEKKRKDYIPQTRH